MTSRSLVALVLAGAAALAGAWTSLRAAPAESGTASTGGLVRLYRADPLAHTLDLSTGAFGNRFHDNELFEGRAHLDYGVYARDALTVALAEDDRGLIVDVGTGDDLAAAYEFEEVDGGGRAFASLRLSGDEFQVRRNFPEGAFQKLLEAKPFDTRRADAFRTSLPVFPGHIYLVRVWHKDHPEREVLAKVLVVDHDPGTSVTLRWAPL